MSDIYTDFLNSVEWNFYSGGNMAYPFTYEFKYAATPATAHYIIVSDEGTSDKPRRHATLAEATKEAERLARLKPGFNFIVYKAVTSKNTSTTPVNTLNFQ
jgi:hypothetical protein